MFQPLTTKNSSSNIEDVCIALVNKDGYFVKVTDKLEHFLGYTREELEKLKFLDITLSEDITVSELLFRALLDGKLEQYQIRKRYIRKDGKVVSMRVTVASISGRNEFEGFFLCKFQDAQIIYNHESDSLRLKEKSNLLDNQLIVKAKDPISEELIKSLKSQRKYFRIKLSVPWCAFMRIINQGAAYSHEGHYRVCIMDIGPGGLKFASDLKLNIDHHVVLEFTLHLLNEDICLLGNIVHKVEISPKITEYGVQFNIDDHDRTRLTRILNDAIIKMRKNMFLKDTNLCNKKSISDCFR